MEKSDDTENWASDTELADDISCHECRKQANQQAQAQGDFTTHNISNNKINFQKTRTIIMIPRKS